MKGKKLVILTLAAALSVGNASAVWAAEGWSQSGSSWVYYNSNGDRLYNTWKKGADNQWRYLDSNGEMAVNTWVDSEYYVDSNGIMLTDKWLKVTDSESESGYKWYYFGSSGKMITDSWKKINDKWYHFDSNGVMETGWILDDMYYTGSDGVMRTGWQKLPPPDGDNDSDHTSPGVDGGDDDGKEWYYFSSNGKKFVPDLSGSDYGARKIDGAYYAFDEDGAMQTGWINVESDSESNDAPITDFMFFGPDGKAKTGWYSTYPPDQLKDYDGEVEWFYFNTNGKPKASDSNELQFKDMIKLNGRTYLFDNKGNPVHGLKKVYTNKEDYTAMYFGDKATSCVQKGKFKIDEGVGGGKVDYYFSDTGKGLSGVRDGYLYYLGKLQKSTDGMKYTVFSIPSGSGFTNYVVNSSGKVMKSKTVKAHDGTKYTTSSTGTLQKVDDEAASGYYNEPEEPIWDED